MKWYTDEAANLTHQRVESFVKPMCAQMLPSHLFTHLGIHRNENTNEVILKIHLRPVGEAVFIRERLDDPAMNRGATLWRLFLDAPPAPGATEPKTGQGGYVDYDMRPKV